MIRVPIHPGTRLLEEFFTACFASTDKAKMSNDREVKPGERIR